MTEIDFFNSVDDDETCEAPAESPCQCHPAWQTYMPADECDDILDSHVVSAHFLSQHKGIEVTLSCGGSVMLHSSSLPLDLQSFYIVREGYGIYFPTLRVEIDVPTWLRSVAPPSDFSTQQGFLS